MQVPEPIGGSRGYFARHRRRRGIAVALVDENGELLTNCVSTRCWRYIYWKLRHEDRSLKHSTTTMLNKLGQFYGVPVYETAWDWGTCSAEK